MRRGMRGRGSMMMGTMRRSGRRRGEGLRRRKKRRAKVRWMIRIYPQN